MIRVEHIEVFNFEGAIRGLRNPMNSWDKSDSPYAYAITVNVSDPKNYIGENDLSLMKRLFKAGHPHRKYLRQIMCSMDIVAPLYWWKEFDTYKVGTTANSCSTMHKIHSKEFELNDFSHEHISNVALGCFNEVISRLNYEREQFNITNDKSHWWNIIQLLPSSYNQRRTVTMNYENVFNILQYRMGHKLDEWNKFCEILINDLPYVKQIGSYGDENEYGREE